MIVYRPRASKRLVYRIGSLVIANALAGCATAPPPRMITSVQTIRVTLPPQLLSCMPTPAVPVAPTQAAVASYIVRLWAAGQDCRGKLAAINRIESASPVN